MYNNNVIGFIFTFNLFVFNLDFLCSFFHCILLLDKCRNPSLGLATKTRGCKVADQVGDPGVTSHAPGSAKSVRESTLTLPW